MGYYTQLAMDVGIREDKIEQFKKAIKRQLARVKADPEYWFAYYADISVDEYGTILFEDYYRKIYDVEKFAKWLAKFVEKFASTEKAILRFKKRGLCGIL